MSKGTIGGGVMGRPTKYSADMVKRGREYLKECEDGVVSVIVDYITKKGKRTPVYGKKNVVKVPTLEGLSLYLGIHKDTIQDWKKAHLDFSVLISDLLAIQGDRLVQKGLSGEYNPTISKVLLSKHGYREGIEQMGEGGSALFKPDGEDKKAADKALDDI